MNPERKIDPEKIQIINIKTLKGNIDDGSETDPTTITGYRFKTDLAIALNLEEKIVGLKLTIHIETLDKNKHELDIKASYTHEFVFRVENLEDFVDPKEEDEKEENIDPLLIGTLAGIAYSTLRGIIITRTQGTPLNAVILPVIDPKKVTGLTIEEKAPVNT
jgi:hypothetical protein